MKLIGYGYDRDMLFIVSEYFPNGSLGSYIDRGKEVNFIHLLSSLYFVSRVKARRLFVALNKELYKIDK